MDGSTHDSPFLTEREVSHLLRMTPPTLATHRRRGTGPPFIMLPASRRPLYRRAEVEAWLEGFAHPSPQAA